MLLAALVVPLLLLGLLLAMDQYAAATGTAEPPKAAVPPATPAAVGAAPAGS